MSDAVAKMPAPTPLATRAASLPISSMYRLWSSSWHQDRADAARLDQVLADGNKVILACWHGKFLPLFSLLEQYDITIFTSDCFRGKVISRICQDFGHTPSLIPQGNGTGAYRHFHRGLKSARIGAFAVDGPLGPAKVTKPGIIKMASSLGHLIVPVSMAGSSTWVMTSRWDKREFPKWGASVSLALGKPVQVPPGLRTHELDEWCATVTSAIDEADQHARARVEAISGSARQKRHPEISNGHPFSD